MVFKSSDPVGRSPDPPLALHGLDNLKELIGVRHLDERTARVPGADYVNRGRVLNSDFSPHFLVGIHHFRRELTLGIDDEWQIDFVLGRKPLREILQSIGSDLRLVLEDEVKNDLQILRLANRIPCDREASCRTSCASATGSHAAPVEFCASSLPALERRIRAALRTLQVLKHNERDRRALGRPQQGRILR